MSQADGQTHQGKLFLVAQRRKHYEKI